MSSPRSGPGRIDAIWIKRAHRGPMDAVDVATLIAGQGLANSVDRSKRRQVSLLERESWDHCIAALGAHADPSRRRANLLVSGISLANTRGRVLVVGSTRLMIGGELRPCERTEEVVPGLQRMLEDGWRGGVFAQVLDGGVIRPGDEVRWEPAPAAPR